MAVNETGASFKNDLKWSHDLEKIGNEISQERKAALDRNIKQLSKREQEAIYLRFYKEMSYPEIAEGFAEKVFSTSATRRQSEAVYEYCELKPTK